MPTHLKRVIEEQHVRGKRLGRHVDHDPKSKDYPVRELLPRRATLASKTWYTRAVLDQGNLGACTGYAAAGMCLTAPIQSKIPKADRPNIDGLKIYELDTTLDDFPGQYPPDDTGSTGLAAMKALKQLGLITEYRWGFSTNDVLQTLSTLGPVCIGIDWYEGFDNPDSSGLISIAGGVRGGHEVRLIGISVSSKKVRGVNSWGKGWGDNGRFTMTWDTLDKLLSSDGDAVTGLYS